jgi:hypothetical protein
MINSVILLPQIPVEINLIINKYLFLFKQQDISKCIEARANYDDYFYTWVPWYLRDRIYERIRTHGFVTDKTSLKCLHHYALHDRYIEFCMTYYGLGCINNDHDKRYYCHLYYDCTPLEYVRQYCDLGVEEGQSEVEDYYLNWNLEDDFVL